MKYLSIVFLLLFIGCKPAVLATKSGKPEVIITNTDVKTVSGALVSRLVTDGFTIDMQTDNLVSAWAMGTAFLDTDNKHSRQYSITKQESDVRVILTPLINGKSNVTQKYLEERQHELELFRDEVKK